MGLLYFLSFSLFTSLIEAWNARMEKTLEFMYSNGLMLQRKNSETREIKCLASGYLTNGKADTLDFVQG